MTIVCVSGWTPLHEAVLKHNYTLTETLLKAGALVNSAGHEGVTPLHDAVQLVNIKVCAFNSLWTTTPAIYIFF